MSLRTPRHTLFPYTTLFRSIIRTSASERMWGRGRGSSETRSFWALLARNADLLDATGSVASVVEEGCRTLPQQDRKSTRLNSSHANISYAVFCLKKKKIYRS